MISVKPHPEFKHGWKLLLVSLIGVITSSNFIPLYSFGPLVQDLSSTLDISLGELQRAITFNFVGLAIGYQLAGWAVARFNLKIVVLVSLLLFAALYALLGYITLNRNLLYLFYFLFPILGCGSLLVTWTHITCQKFEKKRGIALAIILSGSGIVSTGVPLLLTDIVGTEHWQKAFYILAALPLFTFVVCLFALPNKTDSDTSSSHEAPEQKTSSSKTAQLEFGISYLETLKTRRFWTMLIALNLVVFVIVSMITNIVPMLVGKGMTQAEATVVFSSFGISLIVGRLASGILLDRIWGPLVAFFALMLPAIGCLIFLYMPANTALMITATALIGLAAGAEYDIVVYLISRYFGLRAYPKTFGTMSGAISLGSGMSPLIYGPILDATGNYDALLMICSVSTTIGALMFLTLGAYPIQKDHHTATH